MIQAIKTLVLLVIPLVTLVQSTTLKSPKVYNALITTDQNLIPSRAYPVVQPTIHDAGFGYSTFGLGHHHNAFGLYDPYAGPYHPHGGFLGGPVPGGFQARNQYSFFSSQQGKSASGVAAAAAAEESASGASVSSVTSEQAIISGNDAQLDAGSVANTNLLKENPPIPLNEFGLPPNLIPLSTPQDFNRQGNPVNLQPYPYNSYPLIYDSFGGGYNANPYLPPFSYYPSAFGGPGILGGAPGAVAAGAAAGPAGGPVGGPADVPIGGPDGGADGGDAGAAGGADGDAGGSDGGDIDGGQDGDIDGRVGDAGGSDGGSSGGAGGATGGDSDGGSTVSEKQTNDGGAAAGGSSSSGGSSGGSGGSYGSSSSSGGDGSGSSSSSSSSGGTYRGTSRRTGFRGSNIRSALRTDPQNPAQS
ncbi:uncharacterized PE-PGRS family protein PE_PGRS3 [Lutzomyia longipalpis]|uniref:Putative conserved secreted protein n=1 Tax=Lutzomyia longipalpis TaxID=7200 RepID=A0A7G3AJ00_LUTLO|nr:uncharacterized PE-PGRS family protein PE_PGRS3 [Lutzomyia longipalpis]